MTGGSPMDFDKKYIHELLMQLKQNNDAAVEPLLTCFFDLFYQRAVGRYQLSHEDAQDAIQQTFARITNIIEGGRIASYKEEKGGGPAWMWQIFYHVVIDIIRDKLKREKRNVSLEATLEKAQHDLVALEAPEDESPIWTVIGRTVIGDKERAASRKTWEALSEEDRKAILTGRGPGAGRKEYWIAVAHARPLFQTFLVQLDDLKG